MNIFKTPRVRDIPQHKWAIPVPSHVPEMDYQDGWSSCPSIHQVQDMLLEMGFEEATRQRSRHPREFKDEKPTGTEQDKAVWIHAAGAIVEVTSHPDGRVQGIGMHMELDGGVYGPSLMGMTHNCGGSGSCEPKLSGKSHYCKSWHWHSDMLSTLKKILSSVQAAGRVVPFPEWAAGKIHVCGAFPLQALVRIDPDMAAGKSERDIRIALEAQTCAAIGNAYGKWPGLKEMATREIIGKRIHDNIEIVALYDRDWAKAENAMDYCRRALTHARIRWPNPKTREATQHWLLAIASGDTARMTPDDPRMIEPGPAGTRFATCLALEVGRDNGWEIMTSFIDGMSDNDLRNWAASTDAQGNTPFGELLLSHVTEISIFLPKREQIIELFRLVSSRIGVEACPVIIGNKKPWLVLEDAFDMVGYQAEGGGKAMRYLKGLPALVDLFDRLQELGCTDVALDSAAMESIDRIRSTKITFGDAGNEQDLADFMPAKTLSHIAQTMMGKTVRAPRAANRQVSRL